MTCIKEACDQTTCEVAGRCAYIKDSFTISVGDPIDGGGTFHSFRDHQSRGGVRYRTWAIAMPDGTFKAGIEYAKEVS